VGKLTSGPDWTDILTYAWEVEDATGYELCLLTKHAGSRGGLPVNLTWLAAKKGTPPWEAGEGMAVEATWPNVASATLEGAVFVALVQLDAALHKQEMLDIIMPA